MNPKSATASLIRGGSPTVFVSNLDASVRFYTETLGLPLRYRAGEHFAMVDVGQGLAIGLHPPGKNSPAPGTPGCIQIGLEVDGPIERVVETLRDRGVQFRTVDGRVVLDDGPIKLAFFADPDGTELYLCETASDR